MHGSRLKLIFISLKWGLYRSAMNSLSVHATASLYTTELNMLGCPDNSKMYKDQVTKCLVLEFIHSMPRSLLIVYSMEKVELLGSQHT